MANLVEHIRSKAATRTNLVMRVRVERNAIGDMDAHTLKQSAGVKRDAPGSALADIA